MHEISISKPPLRGIVAVKKMRDFLLPFHSRLMPLSFSSHPAFSDQYLYKCFSLYSLLLSWYPFLLLFLLSFTLIILLWDFHYRPIFPLPFHLPCLFIVLLGMVYVFFFSFRFLIFALFSVSTLVLYSLSILLLHLPPLLRLPPFWFLYGGILFSIFVPCSVQLHHVQEKWVNASTHTGNQSSERD